MVQLKKLLSMVYGAISSSLPVMVRKLWATRLLIALRKLLSLNEQGTRLSLIVAGSLVLLYAVVTGVIVLVNEIIGGF
ncbi:MAG: hypothetical protein DRH97_02030 [Chloroflexi bacterium]|nr:MAG: hypothetical protein DRH97_02030 [Chloroflexota bacterium]